MNKITAALATCCFALTLFVAFTHALHAQDIIDRPKPLAIFQLTRLDAANSEMKSEIILQRNLCSSKRISDQHEEAAGTVGCLIPVERPILSAGIPVIKVKRVE
ncbi:MAG: hypothetical protein HY053_08990 [Proteobacteria bacterium]|nr:hypothetical protein [Pseudomonadota bacterium]